jgi:hypothetical protein
MRRTFMPTFHPTVLGILFLMCWDAGTSTEESREERESLADLMDYSGTDKLFRHAYERYYERYFSEFRDMVDIRILEIGADSGISLKVHMIEFGNEFPIIAMQL